MSGFASEQEVASKFAIPEDRVVAVTGTGIRPGLDDYLFKIMPYDEYMKLQSRK